MKALRFYQNNKKIFFEMLKSQDYKLGIAKQALQSWPRSARWGSGEWAWPLMPESTVRLSGSRLSAWEPFLAFWGFLKTNKKNSRKTMYVF